MNIIVRRIMKWVRPSKIVPPQCGGQRRPALRPQRGQRGEALTELVEPTGAAQQSLVSHYLAPEGAHGGDGPQGGDVGLTGRQVRSGVLRH